jgi:hypothetical protein
MIALFERGTDMIEKLPEYKIFAIKYATRDARRSGDPNKHIGSSLDDVLKEEGVLEETRTVVSTEDGDNFRVPRDTGLCRRRCQSTSLLRNVDYTPTA